MTDQRMTSPEEIVHIVLVEWRAGSIGVSEEANRLVDRHLGPLPFVLDVRSGASVSTEGLENGFEWALVIRFADRAGLEAYLPHPEHRVVAEFLGARAGRLVVFDLPNRA
ncbi:Dabb family protein [Cryptosporangium arvum]|uniref:A/B barrel domain-containing protein n=1 Tax=Cryptosporangium arvum DSM 44712 TaxID=927661 RepID=A0A010Z3I6_9ACTN|nr:Dabb family protein [Cryptosporangium arvum]EXG81963.1 A/B barrel domain-containing protein [Cryptosporangium arvum DSM 44712]